MFLKTLQYINFFKNCSEKSGLYQAEKIEYTVHRRRYMGRSSWIKFTFTETDTATISGWEGELTAGCDIVHFYIYLCCSLGTQHHLSDITPPRPQMVVVLVSGKVNFFHGDGPIFRLLNILSSLVAGFQLGTDRNYF